MEIKFEPGAPVWVVERDEAGEPREVSGCMFLAQSREFAIVSPYVNSIEDVDDTLAYLARDTVECRETAVAVFPIGDCFATMDEAMADGGTSVHLLQ